MTKDCKYEIDFSYEQYKFLAAEGKPDLQIQVIGPSQWKFFHLHQLKFCIFVSEETSRFLLHKKDTLGQILFSNITWKPINFRNGFTAITEIQEKSEHRPIFSWM